MFPQEKCYSCGHCYTALPFILEGECWIALGGGEKGLVQRDFYKENEG